MFISWGTVTILACSIMLATASTSYEKECSANANGIKLFPHENCHQFYLCLNWKLTVKSCAEGLLYNRLTQICDWPENVICEQAHRTANEIEVKDIIPIIASTKCAEGSDGSISPHENCNQFYVCLAGKPIERNCAAGLFYNSQTQVCDWPSNVVCGERKSSVSDSTSGVKDVQLDSTNIYFSDASSICAQANSDGSTIAHKNCNQYYVCIAGKPIEQYCAAGLFYNSQTQVCDWSSNIVCGGRKSPVSDSITGLKNILLDRTNIEFSDALAICAQTNSDGITIAHGNCNQFYVCLAGKPIERYCAPGLFYNSQTQVCDWLSNVVCGERKSPVSDSTSGMKDVQLDSTNIGFGDASAICGQANSDGSTTAHKNCNQYYVCIAGKPIEQYCAAGLFYNSQTQVCDWSFNVVCGERKSPVSDSITGLKNILLDRTNIEFSDASAICAQTNSDGTSIAHRNCNQFYVCLAGKPIERSCAPGLFYNSQTQVCDWPSNVVCGKRKSLVSDSTSGMKNVQLDSTNIGFSDTSAICAQANSDGSTIAHKNCNQYYICIAGKLIEQYCAAGLFYNSQTQVCDWSSNVFCGERKYPVSDSITGLKNILLDSTNIEFSDASAICAQTNSDGTTIAHGNCNQFYVCLAGKPIERYCAPGLFYNSQTQVCDWPSNVVCGERKSLVSDSTSGMKNILLDRTNIEFSDASAICAQTNSDGTTIAHRNCNQYYICIAGKPIKQYCAAGLFYNSQTQVCDWSFNVVCGERKSPVSDSITGLKNILLDRTNIEFSDASAICAQTNSDGTTIAHGNCNQFYVCLAGKPIERYCAPDLIYNSQMQVCDWPSNVVCGERKSPVSDSTPGVKEIHLDSTNIGFSDASAICAQANSDGSTIAHKNCNQYYVCLAGKPIEQYCTAGLFYNPQILVCDWSFNVNCENRIIPEEKRYKNEAIKFSPAAAVTCADDVFIGHEKCNYYYVCLNGKPVLSKCPKGLFFNSANNVCDWPANVNCSA